LKKTWLDTLGGRKFVLTIIVIAVGTCVQLFAPGGCNPSFASLLIGVVGAFSAANSFVTNASFTKGKRDESQP
jgi:hypothetical protein